MASMISTVKFLQKQPSQLRFNKIIKPKKLQCLQSRSAKYHRRNMSSSVKKMAVLKRTPSSRFKSKCVSAIITFLSQLRQWNSATSNSYTPVIRFTCKLCMWAASFPFTFCKRSNKFKSCRRSKWHLFKEFLAFATTLLHLVLVLDWFRKASSSSQGKMENWQFVLMTYFLTAFVAGSYCILDQHRFSNEVMFSLNSCIEMERECQGKGAEAYVHRYFIVIGTLVQGTLVAVPTAMSIMALFRPCMPPALSSVMDVDCRSWSDDAAGLLFKMVFALLEAYTWAVTSSAVSFTVYVALLYPIENILLLISQLERNLKPGKEDVVLRYRRVQILTRLFNDAWKFPSMPLAIFTILVTEAVSLYVLITSAKQLPISLLALFLFVAIDFFVMINFIFKILSHPYTRSTEYLDRVGCGGGRNPTKWLLRFIKSCSPSRVMIGDGTFFDSCTSLNTWKLCIDMLVAFLLL